MSGESQPYLDEELPDVSGLTPVRSLRQLRDGGRTRIAPLDALKTYWGYSEFRPYQDQAVESALAKQDVLVVLPTGGGKSLCYQIPAACGAGVVLVVSPLVALMDDQVTAAREAGLRAGALHASRSEAEKRRVRDELDGDRLDLVYVSPERLVLGDLVERLAPRLALIAVDEAHCVSHWGHDFRPEYRQLGALFAAFPDIPRMALTATATPQVQDDICVQLRLRQPRRLLGHVDRANLTYRCVQRSDQMKQILEVVRRHRDEGGIVYAQTRKDVERIAASLVKAGVDAEGYHAGMESERRSRIQHDFVSERTAVVVATIAFGMGIDRSNVRYVIHANAPKSIEHYQQEAGRAGRDGDPAECVLLFSAGDLATHRSLAAKEATPERMKVVNRQLGEVGRFALAPVCRHRLLTEHFGQTYPDPVAGIPWDAESGCGACDVCLRETRELPEIEARTNAQKIISAVWRLDSRYGAAYVTAILRGDPSDARQRERIERSRHDQLSVWSLMKDTSEPTVRAWIDQLVVQGHLAIVEEGDYPLLTLTPQGKEICRDQGAVRLGMPQAKADTPDTGSRKRSRKSSRSSDGPPNMDQVLFERLRTLRRLIAERQHVAPYMIFHDATLHLMADAKPSTLDQLRGIKGVGASKLAHYGACFIRVVTGTDPTVAAQQT